MIEEAFLHDRHEVVDIDLAVELDADLLELGSGGISYPTLPVYQNVEVY